MIRTVDLKSERYGLLEEVVKVLRGGLHRENVQCFRRGEEEMMGVVRMKPFLVIIKVKTRLSHTTLSHSSSPTPTSSEILC